MHAIARAATLVTLPTLGMLALACGDSGAGTTGATTETASASASGTSAGGSSSSSVSDSTGVETSAGPDSGATGGQTTGASAGSTGPGSTTSASESASASATGTETGTTGLAPPDPRQVLLERYAPRVWFPANESYWPSSVDWAFPELERFADGNGDHWLRTIETLDEPSDTLPFFAGQAGDLEGAPVYGYWADKGMGVVDLVYFMWYPYNRGKEVADTVWGNHVGDWEHVTVRLLQNPDESYAPSQVYLSAHSFGGAYDWGGGEVELYDGTHPVVYSAWGSHGLWAAPGDHVYMEIGEEVFNVCVTIVCAELTDETSAGVAWDTWHNVYGMDFALQEGLMGATWPAWMSDDFKDPGAGDPSVPGMGPIYRWGNPEDCSVLGIPIDITDLIGICRLEDGPTGPISKTVWGPDLQ